MRLRAAVMAAAGFGIPLALLVLALPITWGYGGYNFSSDGAGIFFLDPSGPGARAGLRPGDRPESLSGMDNIAQFGGAVGTVVHLRVVRSGAVVPITVTFEAFRGALGTQQVFNKILGALTALGAFIVAFLVLLRARNAEVGARASAVLAAAGLDALSVSGGLVTANAFAATLLYYVLPIFFAGAVFWAAFSLLARYPPRQTRLRSIANALGTSLLVAFLLTAAARFYGIWIGQSGFTLTVLFALTIFASVALAAIVIDAIASAPPEYQTPIGWLGGCWLLALIFGVIGPVTGLLNVLPILRSHYGDVLGAAQVFFLAFGVAYPVLRHRMVDLNVLVSRAGAFGIVSIIIVVIFVAAEWAVSRVFEQSFVPNGAGFWPQASTLVIVLVLGVSARSIHRFVESRMTRVFFRTRTKNLAEIRRVAREADACTDAQAMMKLACATALRCLSPSGVACYLRDGDAYVLMNAAGITEMASVYEFNDAVPLRLRRWQEPFEVDDETDPDYQALFLPMMLRSELLGFLRCGPKPDHTRYLEDEVEALSFLAHQVGLAAAWLGRVLPAGLTHSEVLVNRL